MDKSYSSKYHPKKFAFENTIQDPLHEYAETPEYGTDLFKLNEYPSQKRDIDQYTPTRNLTKQLVCCFFSDVIKNESQIREVKTQFYKLLNQKAVSPLQVYQRMDRARKGYITKQDLKEFTKIDEKELKVVFQGQKTSYDKLLSVMFDKEA